MDRLLRSAGGTVEVTNYDTNGDPVDAGAGASGSATIVDGAGAAIAGSPFTWSRISAGLYRITLPSSLSILDVYTVMWTMPDATTRTTRFELVGGFLFTIADLRAFDPALANTSTYPASKIRDKREAVEDLFEHPKITNRAFRPRGRREALHGTGTGKLWTSVRDLSTLVSSSIDGTALTAPEIADVTVERHGRLVRGSGVWSVGFANVDVHLEYGALAPPGDISEQAMRYARHLLVKTAIEPEDRATAVFTDAGGYRLNMAGRDGPTGLPEVDAALGRYSAVKGGVFAS